MQSLKRHLLSMTLDMAVPTQVNSMCTTTSLMSLQIHIIRILSVCAHSQIIFVYIKLLLLSGRSLDLYPDPTSIILFTLNFVCINCGCYQVELVWIYPDPTSIIVFTLHLVGVPMCS